MATIAAAENKNDIKIVVGGVQMALGESESDVLPRLQELYNTKGMGAGQWIIRSTEGPPFVFYGMVRFSNGRLVYASRDWEPDNQRDGVSVAKAAIHGVEIDVVRFQGQDVVSIREKWGDLRLEWHPREGGRGVLKPDEQPSP